MRQAADILASPAAMQIRQLEALQAMAKTAASKVVFVPMQLQSDVVGQMAQHPAEAGTSTSQALKSESGEGMGDVARVGLLNSVTDV